MHTSATYTSAASMVNPVRGLGTNTVTEQVQGRPNDHKMRAADTDGRDRAGHKHERTLHESGQ